MAKLPGSPPGACTSEELHGDRYPRQGRSSRTPVTACEPLDPGRLRLTSSQPVAGSGRSVVQLALSFRATGAPFREPELPARHGDGSPRLATSPRSPQRRSAAGPPRGRHLLPISATDLMSTSTCQIVQLPSAGLSPSRPSLPAPLPTARTLVRTLAATPCSMVSDDRKRRPRPRVVRRLVPPAPAVTMIYAPRQRGCLRRPSGPDMTRVGPCRTVTSRAT